MVAGVLFALAALSPGTGEDRAIGVAVGGIVAFMTTVVGTAAGIVVSFTHTETWVSFDPATVPVSMFDAPR